jgi:hypothetical protein
MGPVHVLLDNRDPVAAQVTGQLELHTLIVHRHGAMSRSTPRVRWKLGRLDHSV